VACGFYGPRCSLSAELSVEYIHTHCFLQAPIRWTWKRLWRRQVERLTRARFVTCLKTASVRSTLHRLKRAFTPSVSSLKESISLVKWTRQLIGFFTARRYASTLYAMALSVCSFVCRAWSWSGDQLQISGSGSISGTAQPRLFKFCTHLCQIKC